MVGSSETMSADCMITWVLLGTTAKALPSETANKPVKIAFFIQNLQNGLEPKRSAIYLLLEPAGTLA
ncbi:hypothetical protein MGR01S_07080 [Meiothermus granaticius NBRC 107808]|nr:hypothetical protein MGR01S_07080 [Meiothermus granaticius NBRC 107808]